jgi:hypothetical protein
MLGISGCTRQVSRTEVEMDPRRAADLLDKDGLEIRGLVKTDGVRVDCVGRIRRTPDGRLHFEPLRPRPTESVIAGSAFTIAADSVQTFFVRSTAEKVVATSVFVLAGVGAVAALGLYLFISAAFQDFD